MNRFAAHGIAADALKGRSILVLTIGVHEISHVLGELNEQLPDELPARVMRTNSRSEIVIGAGRIRVESFRRLPRSVAFDVVYLDAGVDAEIFRDPGMLKVLQALIATSEHGEIVRA